MSHDDPVESISAMQYDERRTMILWNVYVQFKVDCNEERGRKLLDCIDDLFAVFWARWGSTADSGATR